MGTVESKEETGQAELETLKMMVSNWRRGYETWLTPGDNEYVFEEFVEDIQIHLAPYVERLLQTEYWSDKEGTELSLYILSQLEELKGKANEL